MEPPAWWREFRPPGRSPPERCESFLSRQFPALAQRSLSGYWRPSAPAGGSFVRKPSNRERVRRERLARERSTRESSRQARFLTTRLAEIYSKTWVYGTKNPSEGISLLCSIVRANIPFSRCPRSKKTQAASGGYILQKRAAVFDLRVGKELVLVDYRGYGHLAGCASFDPHDPPLAADANTLGQGNFWRQGQGKVNG